MAQFRAETDPVKKADLSAKIAAANRPENRIADFRSEQRPDAKLAKGRAIFGGNSLSVVDAIPSQDPAMVEYREESDPVRKAAIANRIINARSTVGAKAAAILLAFGALSISAHAAKTAPSAPPVETPAPSAPIESAPPALRSRREEEMESERYKNGYPGVKASDEYIKGLAEIHGYLGEYDRREAICCIAASGYGRPLEGLNVAREKISVSLTPLEVHEIMVFEQLNNELRRQVDKMNPAKHRDLFGPLAQQFSDNPSLNLFSQLLGVITMRDDGFALAAFDRAGALVSGAMRKQFTLRILPIVKNAVAKLIVQCKTLISESLEKDKEIRARLTTYLGQEAPESAAVMALRSRMATLEEFRDLLEKDGWPVKGSVVPIPCVLTKLFKLGCLIPGMECTEIVHGAVLDMEEVRESERESHRAHVADMIEQIKSLNDVQLAKVAEAYGIDVKSPMNREAVIDAIIASADETGEQALEKR